MFHCQNKASYNILNKRGVSLVEILTVLAIVGIGVGLFYSVFFVNWISFEKELALADLQLEADEAMESIALDVRYSEDFTVSGNGKEVVVGFPQGGNVTYTLTDAGEISRTRDSTIKVLSPRADQNASVFTRIGNYLDVSLALFDTVVGHRLNLTVSTQVCPRNAP